ncbi:contact-dependent growth inhibition system immunity protein [Pectobacterium polonicum]|uniref:contact-dependent growth inhibition system immunity protein n=1 Tax=Pectobacterium polonicum TaxID=2485124 RepID=UPI002361BD56|nr:contact-dependent growth inhibition system immunity protein [Pectobacterium polonicum]MDC9817935.1 contact-dependent growth inhibition system immunity protein [Pectobacterium polonicum]
MTTFRELLLISNSNYEPNKRSSLDEWFSGILDVSLDELDVSDVARAIRQDLFLAAVLPKAEIILKNNPLAGDDYDGQLISSIASLNSEKIKVALPCFRRVSSLLNQLDKNSLDAQLVMDIEKIEKLSRL